MAVYNPAQTRTSVMRVKVPNGNAQVYDVRGNRITTDVVCANITDVTDCDVFFTTRFNGSSLNYFYLEPAFNTRELIMTNLTFNKPYRINDEQFIQASSYSDYQLIVTKNGVNHTFNFSLSYRQYFSNENDWCGGMSGAYIFRPTSDQSSPYSQFTSASIVIGQNLLQIRIIGSATTTNMRIYNDISKGIEIETFVNSLPYNSGSGVEVILVVNSPNITNNKTFYTDSMGMEMQKRIINYRPSWKLNPTQYVSGNYYPVTAAIYIKDVNSGVMMG
jgi:Glycosyl hydrolases family 38 C-terminal domain.